MSTVAITAALIVVLTFFLAYRGSRSVAAWGAAWGPAAGFWLLTPPLLAVHHLHPSTRSQWFVLDAGLALIFAIVGSVCAAIGATPIAMFAVATKKELRSPVWAHAIVAAASMPFVYLGVSAMVEWWQTGIRPALTTYAVVFRPVTIGYAALLIVLVIVYVARVLPAWDPRARTLLAAIGVAAIAGIVALPGRVVAEPSAGGPRTPPQLVRRSAPDRTPLLVIGLDGGNWRAIRPVMERGKAATFSRLVSTGIQGTTPALFPPYWSGPAWAAIVTGHSPDENGVHEDLSAKAPGLPYFELPLEFHPALNPLFVVEYALIMGNAIEPMPTPRGQLAWPPIWERISHAGVRTAVVRFPFTYPAHGQAQYVISNRVVTDLWGALNVKKGAVNELTEPRDAAIAWLERFNDDRPDPALLAWLLPRQDWPKPRDAAFDPIEVLKLVTARRQQMNDGAVSLLQSDPNIDVFMMHITSFDNVCHAFWPYRFPEDYPTNPPAPEDVVQLGPVIDRFVELVDRQIAQVIAAFPQPPNVLIVSDHGEGAAPFYTVWRGWHASPGMFLAAGPDIPHRDGIGELSYYDVAPTILDLEGFEKPEDLRGRSLLR